MASAAEQLAANINFGAFAKATELKRRIWFTLGALLVYRLGTYIPIPGIDPTALADIMQQQQGGIVEKEASIALSNVMVVCGKCSRPTRVKRLKQEGARSARACRQCGEALGK